jgi:hypothetical protein
MEKEKEKEGKAKPKESFDFNIFVFRHVFDKLLSFLLCYLLSSFSDQGVVVNLC